MKIRRILLIAMLMVGVFGLSNLTTAKADSLKPIRGVRRTSVNKVALAKKAKMNKKIGKEKQKVVAAKEAVRQAKAELLEYQKVQGVTGETGTVFADNGQGNGLFNGVAVFDNYFKGIANYGNVNDGWIQAGGYLNPNVVDAQNPYLENLPVDSVSTVSLLQAENVETVDISTYLSYAIYEKQKQIDKLRNNLKKKRGRLRTLRKKAGRIDTGRITFNANDITEVSHITKTQMRAILKGTRLERYAGVYVDIEKKYGINAIAFCALSAFESGWGESHRARVDHNYTGFGVYSNSSVGINASSGEANLYMTAKHLANHYLHRGDMYYHGRGLDGLNRSYSTAGVWAYEIEKIGVRLMGRL